MLNSIKKIKLFSSNTIEQCEEEVNKFISDNFIDIVSINTSVHPMHDEYDNGTICNRWSEYIVTLIYKS